MNETEYELEGGPPHGGELTDSDTDGGDYSGNEERYEKCESDSD